MPVYEEHGLPCKTFHFTLRCLTSKFIQTAQQEWQAQMQIPLHCGRHCTNLHKTCNIQIFADISCSKFYSHWTKMYKMWAKFNLHPKVK